MHPMHCQRRSLRPALVIATAHRASIVPLSLSALPPCVRQAAWRGSLPALRTGSLKRHVGRSIVCADRGKHNAPLPGRHVDERRSVRMIGSCDTTALVELGVLQLALCAAIQLSNAAAVRVSGS